jgi:hypothetical protein
LRQFLNLEREVPSAAKAAAANVTFEEAASRHVAADEASWRYRKQQPAGAVSAGRMRPDR